MDDDTAVRRRAVLDAYMAGCRDAGIRPEKWATGALFAWATFDRETEAASYVVPPAATWEEHDARRQAVEALHEAVRARLVDLPEQVTVRLMQWIHDIRGWNA